MTRSRHWTNTPTSKTRGALTSAAVAVAALSLTGCGGGGPGDEQDLSDALTRDDVFTTAEADCIAEKVFAEYGDDEDALGKISGADDIAELESGEKAVEGFADNFATYQQDCADDS